jgi:hypothetical protein
MEKFCKEPWHVKECNAKNSNEAKCFLEKVGKKKKKVFSPMWMIKSWPTKRYSLTPYTLQAPPPPHPSCS